MKYKRCYKCQLVLDIDKFSRDNSYKDGYNSTCKECNIKKHQLKNSLIQKDKEYHKTYQKNNPIKYMKASRKYRLKSKYNLSPEEFESMIISQENKCALCGEHFRDTDAICIDHDHETGEIRGILHRNCNTGIGMFCDDPELTNKATLYLKRFKK